MHEHETLHRDTRASLRGGREDTGAYWRDEREGAGPWEMDEHKLATALGWFSIGLGLTELLAPRAFARAIGIHNEREGLVRACGVREISSGIGILSDERPVGWLWSRVAGDLMDLALLGGAAADPCSEADRRRLSFATAAVVGATALDFLASSKMAAQCAAETGGDHATASERGATALLGRGRQRQVEGARRARSRAYGDEGWGGRREASGRSGGWLTRAPRRRPTPTVTGQGVHVRRRMFIHRPRRELFEFWQNFENLPSFMRHLESVTVTDDKRSRWAARGPAGMQVEWEAEVIDFVPGELITWASLDGADVENSGFVRFEEAPAGRGSIVTVELWYRPPAGRLGRTIALLFGEEPEWQIEEDLRRFKALMETGEIPISDGMIWGVAQPPPPERVRKVRERGRHGTLFGSEDDIARRRAEQHVGTEEARKGFDPREAERRGVGEEPAPGDGSAHGEVRP